MNHVCLKIHSCSIEELTSQTNILINVFKKIRNEIHRPKDTDVCVYTPYIDEGSVHWVSQLDILKEVSLCSTLFSLVL